MKAWEEKFEKLAFEAYGPIRSRVVRKTNVAECIKADRVELWEQIENTRMNIVSTSRGINQDENNAYLNILAIILNPKENRDD